MKARVNHLLRLFGTGLGFFMFGLGGVALAILLLPVVWVFGRTDVARKRLGRAVVQGAFRCFLGLLRVCGVAEFHFEGFDALQNRKGLLVIANHPTLIDVICLVARIDNADCVVKQSLKRNPATYGPITATGYLTNSGGEDLIGKCVESIRQGNNLIIFPEGTRSVPGQLMVVQRGAANIAIEGNIDLTPVKITCEPSTLTKNQHWYDIPERKFVMTLTVLDDIRLQDVLCDDLPRTRAARKLSDQMKSVLSQESVE